MIEVKDLHFSYPDGREVLRGVDLSIEEGAYVGVVGANGSGKSTFLKHLNALLLPTQGQVLVDGECTAASPDAARSRVGMVLQNPENQIVGSVVEDDVAFGPENLRHPHEEIVSRVGEALARVGLAGLEGRAAETLSGGQKQRLAIAGVLAMRPRHIVVDEPTSMLDPAGREEVRACLRGLNRDHGITVLHVTHLLEELGEATRVLAIAEGQVVFDGPPEDLFRSHELLERLELELPAEVALALGLERELPEPATVPWTLSGVLEALGAPEDAGPAATARRPDEVEADAGPGTGGEAAPTDALLGARGLDLEYAPGSPLSVTALRDIDLAVRPGELLGIVGSTGSGKSTLIQVLAGLLDASSGEVLFAPDFDKKRLYRHVGVVFQQPEDQLFEETVADDVAFGPRQLELSPDEVGQRVVESLARLGLDPAALGGRSPFDLSGGEKRRVAIAGVLSMRPQVLIFDEPTAGLDARSRRLLLEDLQALHAEGETTIVVVSHDMDLLARLASRLVVLRQGRVVRSGPPAQVFADVEAVRDAGLRPPYSVTVLDALRRRGWDLPLDLFEPDRAAAAIAAAARSRA